MRWTVVVASLLLAPAAFAQSESPGTIAIRNLSNCLQRAVLRFEPSGDDARSVSAGAVAACDELVDEAAYQTLALTPGVSLEFARAEVTRIASNIAVQATLTVRACRRTRACSAR